MKAIKQIFTFCCTALLLTSCVQYLHFTNPVIRKDLPDPSIIRIGNTYYAAGTSGNAAKVYPLYTSENLVDWQPIGHVFDHYPDWAMGDFWAPELFAHNQKVYCYYTARGKSDKISCIGVAVADGPRSPFVDHGPLVKWTNEAIDSYVFDDNGQLYIVWKAYGLDNSRPIELLAQRLSDDGLHLEGQPFSLLTDMENIGMEGQCVFHRGEWYYIVYAARDCCSERSDYEVRVARAKTFAGPYETYSGNPILKGDGKDIQSCGHGTIVTTPNGRMFYLCHAFQPGEKFKIGRQPILQEMEITRKGWLRFKTGNITRIHQKMIRPFCR